MNQHVEDLRKARENFVRKRRAMAAQMIPAGALGAHFAPRFVELQEAIEAIDRAIRDEEALPDGYAPEIAPTLELATVDGESVDREYDPA